MWRYDDLGGSGSEGITTRMIMYGGGSDAYIRVSVRETGAMPLRSG